MAGAEIIEVADIILKFKDRLSKLIGSGIDEIKQFFGNGIEDYLTIQYQKFAFTKTFLYRDQPVDFYQTFYPVKISQKRNQIATDDLTTFLLNHQFVGIIGQAGSGKTMLTKHIFLTSFNQLFKIPIVVEIRNLNIFKGALTDYLTQTILSNKIAMNSDIMKRLLEKGAFLFIFDGYDEIYEDKKQIITEEIDQFIDLNNNNHFIISSRPGTNVESLPRFSFFKVLPLEHKDISKFIDYQIQYFEDKALIKKIKEIVELPENQEFLTFIQNPLLLSMFILTYADHPELPKLKSTFYYNVYDTLATKHDTITKKGGYQHERHSGLQKDDIVLFLKFFSLQSMFEGKYSFDDHYFNSLTDKIKLNLKLKFDNEKLLYDLLVSVNIFLRDGNLITYPHKSLQEFFSAACIATQGETFKEKVYGENLKKYLAKSQGAVKNFWDILIELDKEYFYRLFIIPNVKSCLNRYLVHEFTPIKTVTSFLVNNNYTHYVRLDKEGNCTEAFKASHRFESDIQIMNLFINRDIFAVFLTKKDILKNVEIILAHRNSSGKINEIEINYSKMAEPIIQLFLKDSDIVKVIWSYFIKVKEKLEQITKDLQEDINSKISFLD